MINKYVVLCVVIINSIVKTECNSTETTIEVTESTIEVTESTIDVTESTIDVTESTIEVSKSTIEVTNSTVDVTESTIEATNSTAEVTKSTIQVTKPVTPHSSTVETTISKALSSFDHGGNATDERSDVNSTTESAPLIEIKFVEATTKSIPTFGFQLATLEEKIKNKTAELIKFISQVSVLSQKVKSKPKHKVQSRRKLGRETGERSRSEGQRMVGKGNTIALIPKRRQKEPLIFNYQPVFLIKDRESSHIKRKFWSFNPTAIVDRYLQKKKEINKLILSDEENDDPEHLRRMSMKSLRGTINVPESFYPSSKARMVYRDDSSKQRFRATNDEENNKEYGDIDAHGHSDYNADDYAGTHKKDIWNYDHESWAEAKQMNLDENHSLEGDIEEFKNEETNDYHDRIKHQQHEDEQETERGDGDQENNGGQEYEKKQEEEEREREQLDREAPNVYIQEIQNKKDKKTSFPGDNDLVVQIERISKDKLYSKEKVAPTNSSLKIEAEEAERSLSTNHPITNENRIDSSTRGSIQNGNQQQNKLNKPKQNKYDVYDDNWNKYRHEKTNKHETTKNVERGFNRPLNERKYEYNLKMTTEDINMDADFENKPMNNIHYINFDENKEKNHDNYNEERDKYGNNKDDNLYQTETVKSILNMQSKNFKTKKFQATTNSPLDEPRKDFKDLEIHDNQASNENRLKEVNPKDDERNNDRKIKNHHKFESSGNRGRSSKLDWGNKSSVETEINDANQYQKESKKYEDNNKRYDEDKKYDEEIRKPSSYHEIEKPRDLDEPEYRDHPNSKIKHNNDNMQNKKEYLVWDRHANNNWDRVGVDVGSQNKKIRKDYEPQVSRTPSFVKLNNDRGKRLKDGPIVIKPMAGKRISPVYFGYVHTSLPFRERKTVYEEVLK